MSARARHHLHPITGVSADAHRNLHSVPAFRCRDRADKTDNQYPINGTKTGQ
jgi:hypothetical protein